MVLDETRPIYSNIANSSKIVINDRSLNIIPNGPISGIQISIIAEEVVMNSDLNMDIAINKIEGIYEVLIYSIDGNVISKDMPLFFTNKEYDVSSIIIANTNAEEVDIVYDFMPDDFVLNQNHPNPFNPVTNIEFSIKKESYVTLKVMNLLGREINTLVNDITPSGFYSVQWDGKTSSGSFAPSGIYIYQLQSVEGTLSRKMVLMK